MTQEPRRELALQTSEVLRTLNPTDEPQRLCLARRLRAAGITQGMHNDGLSTPSFQEVREGATVQDALSVTKDNYAKMFGSMLDMLDWPRDKRIEWQLGQLLFSLEKPSPALDPHKIMRRAHDRLLELCEPSNTALPRSEPAIP
uniref:hypothetical protein n=1 Tax=Streptomyces sp. NRRL F-5917 TaxID=1463873 RepID=UPI0005642DA7